MPMTALSPEAGEVIFSVRIRPIAYVLIIGLLLRLALATLPAFPVDMGALKSWSVQLASHGPWNFYRGDFFADYAPGYLYVLLLYGGLNTVFQFSNERFEYLLKLPFIAADLASAYLLYRLLQGQRPALRLGAAALYLLLPATLFLGPVWGQVDGFLAFFLLLTIYYFTKGRPVAGSLAYAIGFMIKPQAVAALPILAFWLLRDYSARVWLQTGLAAALVGLLLVLPFFPENPLGLIAKLRDSAAVYPYNSFWAYNFWGLFGTLDRGIFALFRPDSATFLGVSHRDWGLTLFFFTSLAIIFVFRRSKDVGQMSLAIALGTFAFYLFLTRMHERYLFPALLPLLAAAVLLRSRPLLAIFAGLNVVHFLNHYHVYRYYDYYFKPDVPRTDGLFLLLQEKVFLLSALMVAAFVLLLVVSYALTNKKDREALT